MLLRVLFYFFLPIAAGCLNKPKSKIANNYSNRVVASPEIFAEGVISQKGSSEFDICFSPDGLTAYFTRRVEGEMQKIWQSTFAAGQWSLPVRASFSTDRDEMPFVAPDGKTVYFGSARPIEGRPGKGSFDMNIWKAELTDSGWSQPAPLDAGINAIQQEMSNGLLPMKIFFSRSIMWISTTPRCCGALKQSTSIRSGETRNDSLIG